MMLFLLLLPLPLQLHGFKSLARHYDATHCKLHFSFVCAVESLLAISKNGKTSKGNDDIWIYLDIKSKYRILVY